MSISVASAFAKPQNNFGLLRLIAAAAVVVSHAWLVTTGFEELEPLFAQTGQPLGAHAVHVFFGISGFLVAASWSRKPDPIGFLTARSLRILPGFLVAAAFVFLIMAPIITRVPLYLHLADTEVWQNLSRVVLTFSGSTPLPHGFDANPFGGAAMAPVWTLKWEIVCYFSLALFAMAGLTRGVPLLAVIAGFIGLSLAMGYYPQLVANYHGLESLSRLPLCFALGVAAWEYRDQLRLSWLWLALLALLTAGLYGTPFFRPMLYIAEVYAALTLALATPALSPEFFEEVDLSYGIYLFGWPITQAIVGAQPFLASSTIAIMALGISMSAAVLSWRFVEKPALLMKGTITEAIRGRLVDWRLATH